MITCRDLLKTWAAIRPYIPDQHGRGIVFAELIELLEGDGWDQSGYLHEHALDYLEVLSYCNKHGIYEPNEEL